MRDLAFDVFPARLLGPEVYERVRVISDGSTLWLFSADGTPPQLVVALPIDAIETLRPRHWRITINGQVYDLQPGGSCGCGNPLKRASAQSLLELAGIPA